MSCSSSIIKALLFCLVFGLMAVPGFGEFLVLLVVDLFLSVVGDIIFGVIGLCVGFWGRTFGLTFGLCAGYFCSAVSIKK